MHGICAADVCGVLNKTKKSILSAFTKTCIIRKLLSDFSNGTIFTKNSLKSWGANNALYRLINSVALRLKNLYYGLYTHECITSTINITLPVKP